jgi:hypothetical protein
VVAVLCADRAAPAPPVSVVDVFGHQPLGHVRLTQNQRDERIHHAEEGHWLGYDEIVDPEQVAGLARRLRQAERQAVPLNVFLARLRGE